MKKRLIKLAIALPVLLLTLTSCENYRCFEGSGEVRTETRYLENFNKVELDLGANVELVYDSNLTSPKIIIKAREDVIERIRTYVEVGSLLVDSRRCISSDSPAEVTLYFNELNRFELNGAGDVNGVTTISSSYFKLYLNGSGNLDVDLNVIELETKISGSGNIEVTGEADSIIAKVSGSGNIKTSTVLTKNADVKISGSGNVRVYASEELKVKVSGSGNVYYKGEPEVDVKITGSGDVMKF